MILKVTNSIFILVDISDGVIIGYGDSENLLHFDRQ